MRQERKNEGPNAMDGVVLSVTMAVTSDPVPPAVEWYQFLSVARRGDDSRPSDLPRLPVSHKTTLNPTDYMKHSTVRVPATILHPAVLQADEVALHTRA